MAPSVCTRSTVIPLEKGFGATFIEEVIAEAGITKSGFFYHFHNKHIVFHWRARFRGHFEAILECYEPRVEFDPDAMADMVSAVIEGGLVLVRATGDRRILPDQIMLLRSYVKLLFDGDAHKPAGGPA